MERRQSAERLRLDLKKGVVDLRQRQAVAQSVDQDGVPLLPRVQRRMVRLYQQALGFLQTGVQTDTQAQKPVAGGGSPSRKDLVQIDLADAGGLGQRRLGGVPRLKQCLQRMGQASCAEAGGVSERMRSRSLVSISSCRSWFVFFSIMAQPSFLCYYFLFYPISTKKQYAGCIVQHFSAPQRGKILYRYAANRYTF